ncbi:hypothetical protein SDC9_130419 [bioreactor metagenome]|uniref:Uncharacterized protein n=1 Tax=bioreactor metagenome TaxID=1076179 RepID=A0A645D2F4_9ZZZZ
MVLRPVHMHALLPEDHLQQLDGVTLGRSRHFLDIPGQPGGVAGVADKMSPLANSVGHIDFSAESAPASRGQRIDERRSAEKTTRIVVCPHRMASIFRTGRGRFTHFAYISSHFSVSRGS